MKTISFQISDEAYDLFLKICESPAEYRDPEYGTLEDFKSSGIFEEGVRTEDWFLNRNFGGTYYLTHELLIKGLIKTDLDSWHLTYIPTSLGREFFAGIKDQKI